MHLRRGTRNWMALAIVSFPIAGLRGQGFGLNELSTCGIGRAYSAVATGCHDPSAIYWNPAAITSLNGWGILLGASAIAVDGKFEQDTTFRTFKGDVPTAIVPHGYLSYHNPNSRVAWGLGVYVPYGLTTQWKDDFPGRFSAKKASLQTIYVQPSAAWQINSRISVGVGPVIAHSHVELIQGIDLSQQTTTIAGQTVPFTALGIATRTEFARATLKGDAWGYGAHVGVQARLSSSWMFGIRYLTPITFNYDDADATFAQVPTNLILGGAVPNPANPTGPPLIGAGAQVDTLSLLRAAFASGGPLTAQKVSTKITHPAQLQLGFAYTGYKNWELEADYAYVGYHEFHELPINFSNAATPDRTLIEDYNNSSSIRLGAEYRFSNDVHVRGGFAGVTRAAPDATVTPLLPEQDRANYALGVSVPVFGRWIVDGGYVLVTTPGRRGRIDERISRSQSATQLNTGVYSLTANIFALSLEASF